MSGYKYAYNHVMHPLVYNFCLLRKIVMFPPPKDQINVTAPEFETTPLVKPTGFREYDARWLFPRKST